MCETLEEYAEEYAKKNVVERVAKYLIVNTGLSDEHISEVTELSITELKTLKEEFKDMIYNKEFENDILADIFNSIFFEGEKIIDPQKLCNEPTVNFFDDDNTIKLNRNNNTKKLSRDIIKSYDSNQMMLLLEKSEDENIDENEDDAVDDTVDEDIIESPIPIRIMGYEYNNYKRQLDNYTNTKGALMKQQESAVTDSEKAFLRRAIDDLGEFNLVPALTLVLNMGKRALNQKKSLSELSADSTFTQYMQDYKVTVVDVRNLSREVRNRFTSDFRFIANVMAENTIPEEDREIPLSHPVETLDMLITYTDDKRYKSIRDCIAKKSTQNEVITMGDVLDKIKEVC